MENIFFEKSDRTPSVTTDYERGILEVCGRSMPEDAITFYTRVSHWIDDFADQPKPKQRLTVSFMLEYYNTSSSKCILDILKSLGDLKRRGWPIEVNWVYMEEEDDMQANGTELQTMLDYHLNIVPYDKKKVMRLSEEQ
ncbi:MAG: DUF1987 domain-containing protein [Bacteroidales bacterium]|nr:DUF1987 domain-containing protein [Bacteroidales bacterium]